jgi:hypothetical protein
MAAQVLPANAAGLWVGEVSLFKVNEVTVPINAANVAVAPDPNVATPTKDVANLRLIMHVNSNGVVRLLKSVAVIDKGRTNAAGPAGASVTNVPLDSLYSVSETNLVLVTDEALFPNYPGIATRIASAAYDFSDYSAVLGAKAVQAKADAAARAASDTANAASTATALTTVSNSVWTAAISAARNASASGADLVIMTNVVKSIVAATVDQLSQVRARHTLGYLDRAKIDQAASNASSSAMLSQVRAAGAVPVTSVALTGSLIPGGTLSGTLYLGDDHPTNPFRHKFHPDHTYGFEITRKLSLTVDTSGSGAFQKGSFGVDRLTGVYKEEIFGLHKPLGPQSNIGLKTEGTFTLSRLTTKDSLNQ